MVWLKYLGYYWSVVFHDGTGTYELGVVDWHESLDMNDNGWVVWGGYPNVLPLAGVFLFNGIFTTRLNPEIGYNLRMNNHGHVVWRANDGDDWEIFFYDGMSTVQLTNNDYDDDLPQINNNGYVVWSGCPGQTESDCDTDYEIFLYDGTSTMQLTNNTHNDMYPEINDNGYVVWNGWDGSDGEIFLYDGTSTRQLTDNSYHDSLPKLNNNGYTVWAGCDGADCPGGEGDYEIFLYDGSSTTPLTNNDYPDVSPKINNNGYVVWEGVVSGYEVFLAIPCDSDDDGYESPSCGGDDCHDTNPYIYPTNSNTNCNCEEPVPQGTTEVCSGGVDEDCDGLADCEDSDCSTDPACYTGVANAEASVYGPSSATVNGLTLILIPVGAVVLLRLWRRER